MRSLRRTGPGVGAWATRRRRLERERTQARLRKREGLEAELREQREGELGPQGRPMGEAAMRLWRDRRVDDYLNLPPWQRAWRTWQSWGWVRRALAALAVVVMWPVLMLPLRMAGLVDVRATEWGVIALLCAVPLAAVTPPWRRGRFQALAEGTGPAWSASRRAASLRRGAGLAATVALAVFAVLLALQPGSPDAGERQTAAHFRADRIVVEHTVAGACGGPVPVEVRHLSGDRYAAALPDGTEAQVEVIWPGRSPVGTGAGHGEIVGAPPSCPAGG